MMSIHQHTVPLQGGDTSNPASVASHPKQEIYNYRLRKECQRSIPERKLSLFMLLADGYGVAGAGTKHPKRLSGCRSKAP
jgi:hypothetical protein